MTNNNDRGSIFLKNIERGKQEGLISFTDDNARISYHCSREYSTSFKNPEETVRASYFVELGWCSLQDTVINYKKENNKSI